MDNENNNQEPIEIEKARRPFKIEFLIAFTTLLVTSVIFSLLVYFLGSYNKIPHLIEITYSKDRVISFDRNFMIASVIFGLLLNLVNMVALYFIRPSGIKPDFGSHCRWLISLGILSLFGWLAFVVIDILLSGFGVPDIVTALISSGLVSIYDYLIYKLYMEKRTYSNHLFWELFRFAIVGLVAAVFDFLICFFVQFVCFKGNEAGYVTIVSTLCGFLVGVIINYLMSTYMVYKASKSTFSKTPMGILVFVVLSALGLGIGIGLQYFFYDFLFVSKGISFFSYPVDFVIRTLVVMVYNYVTRKFFIYK